MKSRGKKRKHPSQGLEDEECWRTISAPNDPKIIIVLPLIYLFHFAFFSFTFLFLTFEF